MSLRFFILFAIVALNAFFAAAEVALVSVRRSRLSELASLGNVSAKAALGLLNNPERLLSVTQVGVTLASLGLGWAGEGTLFEVFNSILGPMVTPQREAILHGISFALAFLVMSYFHVVIGEVVPKNLALEKAEALALLVAPVLLVFDRISAPFVIVIERTAAGISRLLGVKGASAGGHSVEELKFIVESSRREGHLEDFERTAIHQILELKDINAREIMTPRRDVVSVGVNATLDDLLRIALEHKYSRLPVYEDKPEYIIGIVHYKDLMQAWQERKIALERNRPARPFRLRRYLRQPLVVPESKPLNQLVDEFREHQTHLAIVVDEFGTITGVVTLEDVLEQIFGSIDDEHDARRPVRVANEGVVEVEGNISILDLQSEYDISLPGDAGFETLAGFLLFKLGYIPTPGETVTYENRTFTVLEMDRNRIARVKILTAEPEPDPAESKVEQA